MSTEWDFFISHASEDKATVARPLALSLDLAGNRTWFDEFELHVGSPLRAKLDEGLAKSRFGVVILSSSAALLGSAEPKCPDHRLPFGLATRAGACLDFADCVAVAGSFSSRSSCAMLGRLVSSWAGRAWTS
jgi:hypothetical protein